MGIIREEKKEKYEKWSCSRLKCSTNPSTRCVCSLLSSSKCIREIIMKKSRKRSIPCDKCPAMFSKKDYLKKHIETAHSVESETNTPAEVMEISEGKVSVFF